MAFSKVEILVVNGDEPIQSLLSEIFFVVRRRYPRVETIASSGVRLGNTCSNYLRRQKAAATTAAEENISREW